ncbi:MAG TPA: hypothetical protein VFF68_05995 [Anaerolineaceae bacterium]|nr:hypothetical protein [Anaerolineaceae bacterium]
MQFKEGVTVFTANRNEVGTIGRVVIDPRTAEVTHLIVNQGLLLPDQKVVPVELVQTADADRVTLRKEVEDLEDYPNFEEQYYREMTAAERSRTGYAQQTTSSLYWYPPYGYASPLSYPTYIPNTAVETVRNIPKRAVPLREGATVTSVEEEPVGAVERVFTEAETDEVTHFLISQGMLFKKHKLVPADWVQSISENEVHLAVGTEQLQDLPDYEGG